VKVLLDECVDWRLSRYITGHEVKTARDVGWGTIKNGELLALAEKEFAVFVTVDRNLSFQQNLPKFDIAVVVLRAISKPTRRSSASCAGVARSDTDSEARRRDICGSLTA
jgi:hypothetical protein